MENERENSSGHLPQVCAHRESVSLHLLGGMTLNKVSLGFSSPPPESRDPRTPHGHVNVRCRGLAVTLASAAGQSRGRPPAPTSMGFTVMVKAESSQSISFSLLVSWSRRVR